MSKIQKVCEKSDDKSIVFKKSSFDRFDDDLMEVILNYLTISDKFRLECLSKQVQSLIFNKQRTLLISHFQSVDNLKEILTNCYQNFGEYEVNYSAFESVLKKCKNLDTIRVNGLMKCNERLIRIIADNSRQLKNISINVSLYSVIPCDSLNHFGQKCGPTLQSISGLPDEQIRHLLSFIPQLRSITVDNIKTILSDEHNDHNYLNPAFNTSDISIFLPKLQEIEFNSCDEKSLNEFQNKYSENLLKITTRFAISQIAIHYNSDAMTSALVGLARFHELRALDLYIVFKHESLFKSMGKGLRQLAEDCPQLRQFWFKLFGNIPENNNLFSIFSTFKGLTTLEINERKYYALDYNLAQNYGSFRDFRHMSQLKHLSLTLDQLNDETIDSIDNYLPQLLSIQFNTNKAITDESLEQLSRLKCLTRLEINCYTTDVDHNITNNGVKHLIEKCDRLRSLSFHQKSLFLDFDISEQSIEAIILKSKRMPKIRDNFSFSVNNNEKSFHLFK